jgi:pyruvate kinase
MRRTKILATLGPVSNSEEMITSLAKAGANLFRINMSHTPHDALRNYVEMIRSVERNLDRPIGILVDLQGPKLRVGLFKDTKAMIKNGDTFRLDSKTDAGDSTRVHLPHPEILEALQPGHRLLIDDGRLSLKVIETGDGFALTTVVQGGYISNKKGVSLPDTLIKTSAMTPKDHTDLEAALLLPIDWVALSFVQRPEDILEVKRIAKGKVGVMAKIEKPQALPCLQEIIEVSDALMVARGDLGVEMPLAQVPGIQKRITRLSRRFGKPVVVATQMLESMITAPLPTRAEVSDVASAVFEGADCVMLSAESAAGSFPIEAVTTMCEIINEVEKDSTYRGILRAQHLAPEKTGADAISNAAREIGENLEVASIICWTSSGATALRVARERANPVTLAISPNIATGRRLTLTWGVHCIVAEDAHDMDDMVQRACHYATLGGYAQSGQRVVIVAGVPLGTPGATNMLRLAHIK